jgi:outer membrane protein assembly factor BamB
MMGRDWTRNAVSPEKNPPTRWQVKSGGDSNGQRNTKPNRVDGNIKWSAPLGSLCISEPVVANGLVWIGTNNDWGKHTPDGTVLRCLRESNGEELYRYFSPRLKGGRAVDWPTFPLGCSPLVEGHHIWFTNNRCEVICLDIGPLLQDNKGKPTVVWKVDMREELGVAPHGTIMFLARSCSVAGYHDWIYVVTNNGVDQLHSEVITPRAPSLVCFNKTNGDVVWEDNSPFDRILHGQWASPLVIEVEGRPQVIVPQGDGWLRSFDPAGDGEGGSKVLWEFDMNPKASNWERGGRGDRNNILATPVFHEGRVYLASGQEPDHGAGVGRLCCIDPTKTGDISSELVVDAKGTQLNLGDEVDRREKMLKEGERAIVNLNSGLVWEYGGIDDDGTITGDEGQIVFHRSVANVAIADGLVLATDIFGSVHCVDAMTGKRCWEYDTLASIWAAPLIVDGKVYIADEEGIVTILRLSREFQKLESIEMDNTIWSSPIFVNGVLYLATRRTLFAIESQPSASGNKANEREDASWQPKKADRFEQRIAKGKNRAPDAIFVPTPHDVVDKMLNLAQVTENDVVCDLGSGDGRIAIAAARKYGCQAIGYEIDREMVAVSRALVREADVEELVRIEHEDMFSRDYSEVSVVTMFLPPRVMDRLLPRLAQLKPGSRIVSHHFLFSDIPPDETLEMESKEDGSKHSVYVWRVPLNQSGRPRGT